MNNTQNNVTRLMQQAAAYFQEGNLEKALRACEQAVHANPSLAGPRNNRGIILKQLGRHEEALAAYDRSLKLDYNAANTHYNRGLVLHELGRLDEAIDAFDISIKLQPEYAEAYSAKGNVYKLLDDVEKATEAYKAALKINSNLENEKYYLSSLGHSTAPGQSPEKYVIELFDSYANTFEKELTEKLHYKTPTQMFNAVEKFKNILPEKLDVLDLGCGTGLCGKAFQPITKQITGVDLSSKMLQKAKEKNIYTSLIQADVNQSFQQINSTFDLIVSADVFIYIGDVDTIFEQAKNKLKPNGLFVFSVETNDKKENFTLRPTGRYAHSLKYIEQLARTYNFENIYTKKNILRYQKSKPIDGAVIIFKSC